MKRKPFLKTTGTDTTVFIDSDTSEILGTSTHKRKTAVSDKDTFFTIYAQVNGLLDDLSKGEIKCLIWLMFNQNNMNNRINVPLAVKKQIAKDKDIALSTVANSIVNLTKKGILMREGVRSAAYIVNPNYFWKGSLENRKKTLKFVLELEYNEPDSIETSEGDFSKLQKEFDEIKTLSVPETSFAEISGLDFTDVKG